MARRSPPYPNSVTLLSTVTALPAAFPSLHPARRPGTLGGTTKLHRPMKSAAMNSPLQAAFGAGLATIYGGAQSLGVYSELRGIIGECGEFVGAHSGSLEPSRKIVRTKHVDISENLREPHSRRRACILRRVANHHHARRAAFGAIKMIQ